MENNTPAVITGTAGGNHIVNAPATTTLVREASPSLLLNEVEQRVVRVRPMSTPVDQITRMIGARKASSMVVDYYTVDTKPTEALIEDFEAVTGQSYDNSRLYTLTTTNNDIFAPTETILLPEVNVTLDNGRKVPLMLYVVGRAADGSSLSVIAVNGPVDTNGLRTANNVDPEMKLVRMGRAAAELDMQTDQFEAMPTKASNNCQIFKAQVEQSAILGQTRKEIDWSFTDQEEAAVMDMRLGMEKSFLFGAKGHLTNPRKGDETLLTGGIWNQAGNDYTLESGELTHARLVKLMRAAFTGGAAGSNRKVLIAGSGLIERLNAMEPVRTAGAGDKVTRWGIDFNEINSKFGTLYVVHSEVFDNCGHENDGLIIDPEYMTKYTHVPFNVEHLDLKKSGVRNVDALVITEASCVVLRHPNAHLRITGTL